MNKVLRGRIYPLSARLKTGLPVSECLLIDTGRVDPAGPDRNRLAGNNSHHQLIRSRRLRESPACFSGHFLPQRQLLHSQGVNSPLALVAPVTPQSELIPAPPPLPSQYGPGLDVQVVSHLQGDENIRVHVRVHVSAGS